MSTRNDTTTGYDATKVYNKVYLGEQTGTEGTGKKVLIDMTRSGDTPEAKTAVGGHPVEPITADKILSVQVTGRGTEHNEAWSSTGHLIEGTCLFNADVSNDTISELDVLEGLKFHQGSGMPESSTGSMPNYRGVVGSEEETAEPKQKEVVIQPMTLSAGAWSEQGYIPTGEGNDAGIGSTKIPSGAYGKGQDDVMTKIKVAGIDYNFISNTMWLFGVQGRLQHNIEPDKRIDNPKLNGFTVEPSEGYDAMAKVTVGETPIEAAEDPESSGSYTCYIGSWGAV